MARKRGTKEELFQLQSKAYALECRGMPFEEICLEVDRSAVTVNGWLRRIRGKKEAKKGKEVLTLHEQGDGISEIIRKATASPSYVYRVLQEREDKQPRVSADERALICMKTGIFPQRDPNDTTAWSLLRQVSELIDDNTDKGLEKAWENVERFEAQVESRRKPERKQGARCLATQFYSLWGSANRLTGRIDKATQAIETARARRDPRCTDCLGEIERQNGWLYYHTWYDSRSSADLDAGKAHFTRSLEIYRRIHPRFGHSVHKNGISGALHGRAAIHRCAGDLQAGLRDSREAVGCLDPKKSPNLVVPCTHLLAVFLAETGQPADFDEAVRLARRIRRAMPEKDGVRYGKVIWLSGLVEDDGEGYLLDARDIFLEKKYAREVETITLDLVAYYSDPVRQLQAIESLGYPDQMGDWLSQASGGLTEVWSAAKTGTLTRSLVHTVRAGLGDELMPDLLWRRQILAP